MLFRSPKSLQYRTVVPLLLGRAKAGRFLAGAKESFFDLRSGACLCPRHTLATRSHLEGDKFSWWFALGPERLQPHYMIELFDGSGEAKRVTMVRQRKLGRWWFNAFFVPFANGPFLWDQDGWFYRSRVPSP